MPERVFEYTEKNRGRIPHMTQHAREPADIRLSIWKNDDKVTAVVSRLIVGVPKGVGNEDKRYYYWRSVSSDGFRRSRSGNILPYQCERNWDSTGGVSQWRHSFPTQPFNWLGGNNTVGGDGAGEAFVKAMFETFGVTKVNDIYPMLDKYELPTYASIPAGLRNAFRADDWTEFTTRTFGKRRCTNALTDAVKNAEPYYVDYVKEFRGLVDDNALVAFLNRNGRFDDDLEGVFRPYPLNIRKFLLGTNQQSRDNLINGKIDVHEWQRIQEFSRYSDFYHRRVSGKRIVFKDWREVATL